MINWMYFPKSDPAAEHLKCVISAFESKQDQIDSSTHKGTANLKSDEVLEIVAAELEKSGYDVEKSKRAEDKIRVPVLFGQNGSVNLAFEVDAYSSETGTVIEVEAGRAVINYQFLKDFYEACMMHNVKYLCLAVKNVYQGNNDFQKVCHFFESLYASNRIQVPLNGILIIGY